MQSFGRAVRRCTFASKPLQVDQIRVQTSLVPALASPMIKCLQTRAIDGDGDNNAEATEPWPHTRIWAGAAMRVIWQR